MTRTILVAMAVSLAAAAIVGISPGHSRADGNACAALPAVVENFEPTPDAPAAPDVAFFEDGETARTLADYRGRGVILNFWATWCAPCVRELPDLDRLRANLADHDIDVIAVSEDRRGVDAVTRFYKKAEIGNLPVLMDKRGALQRQVKVRGLPTTILYDPSGKELGRVVGIAEWMAPPVIDALRACLGTPTIGAS